MPSTDSIQLSDYKDILIDHEQKYRQSTATKRPEVVQEIIEEMSAQSKGTLSKGVVKGLPKVSQLIQTYNAKILFTWA